MKTVTRFRLGILGFGLVLACSRLASADILVNAWDWEGEPGYPAGTVGDIYDYDLYNQWYPNDPPQVTAQQVWDSEGDTILPHGGSWMGKHSPTAGSGGTGMGSSPLHSIIDNANAVFPPGRVLEPGRTLPRPELA